jgi:hypothetical protein
MTTRITGFFGWWGCDISELLFLVELLPSDQALAITFYLFLKIKHPEPSSKGKFGMTQVF